MSRKKPVEVIVSERVLSLLKKEINKNQIARHYLLRMQIILLSSQGRTNFEIASELNTTLPTVRLWRSRWSKKSAIILGSEDAYDKKKNSDRYILKEINEVLSDASRSGSSCRISVEEKLRLQALACQSPADFDLPFSVWTHVELSKQANKMGIKISSSHYGKVLKKRFTTP